jgi:hypothetical protein
MRSKRGSEEEEGSCREAACDIVLTVPASLQGVIERLKAALKRLLGYCALELMGSSVALLQPSITPSDAPYFSLRQIISNASSSLYRGPWPPDGLGPASLPFLRRDGSGCMAALRMIRIAPSLPARFVCYLTPAETQASMPEQQRLQPDEFRGHQEGHVRSSPIAPPRMEAGDEQMAMADAAGSHRHAVLEGEWATGAAAEGTGRGVQWQAGASERDEANPEVYSKSLREFQDEYPYPPEYDLEGTAFRALH